LVCIYQSSELDDGETSFSAVHKSPRYSEVKPLIPEEETQPREPRAVSFMQALRIPVRHSYLFLSLSASSLRSLNQKVH